VRAIYLPSQAVYLPSIVGHRPDTVVWAVYPSKVATRRPDSMATGVAPLQAGRRWRCLCDLTVGSRPLWPGPKQALPLRPHRGQAAPYGLAAGGRPLRAPPYSRSPLRTSRYKQSCLQALVAPTGWSQSAAPYEGGLGRSQSPFYRVPWPQPVAPL
ncbi:hypothetical protein GW17_00034582, partial [Ensete ventricosum]